MPSTQNSAYPLGNIPENQKTRSQGLKRASTGIFITLIQGALY